MNSEQTFEGHISVEQARHVPYIYLPFTVPARMIVQAAQPSNVDTVIVDGRVLKRDGKLTTIDMAKLARDTAETIERARKEAAKEGSGKGIEGLFTR